jgi:hypothetical protein
MLSAYEAGRRQPGVGTLEKLLAGAGMQMVVTLEPLGADLDARIERALATPADQRSKAVTYILETILPRLEGVPFAVTGLAAAVVHGAPVQPEIVDILLPDDDAVLAVVGERLREHRIKVWLEEHDRHQFVYACDVALRVLDPSRWLTYIGEFRVTLCPPESLERVSVVPFGAMRLPVVGLWELEAADPEAAAVLARTREVLAAREGSPPG